MIRRYATCWLLCLVVGMAGCSDTKHSNTGRGIVCVNVWQQHGGCYDVVFEPSIDHTVFTYSFANHPAVWTGMEATIDYEYDTSNVGCAYTAGLVQRWP